ncbi:trypsin-like serine peptidase [Nonomuraea aridisoli]|uniref:Trypsin-like serine protease n=1 Tax=Nonomuraea aridisoli TaxID=2070368 RepID=A0A2W2EDY5_9ACTN|nr:hypothetical protein [Nonomuraea aridisoli]PZG15099.1 hypothetical protein C1J01_25155 [Nonomuraea aridisoli]
MKRILLPASGAILATGLLAAGLAGTAQADDKVESKTFAAEAKAVQTINFWARSNFAALKGAVAFNPDNLEVAQVKSGGGYSADTKPGSTAPIGEEKKTTAKVQNVNLPKTIGKVFFVKDGKKYWCSGTSIQSQYRNLVATAGHCVYDVDKNEAVLDKWVFVPGYYQGKAPFGIYAGKQAFTHYDFDVFEDFDRDYAFVTVYNGLNLSVTGRSVKQVNKAEYDAWKGPKKLKVEEISKDAYDAGVSQYGPEGPYAYDVVKGGVTNVGHDYVAKEGETKLLLGKEVTEFDYNKAPAATDTLVNGEKCPSWCQIDPTDATVKGESGKTVAISEAEYKELVAAKAAGKFLGKVEAKDGSFYKTQYWVKQWVKVDADQMKYYKVIGYFIITPPSVGLKDAGRLGDNVGGQGVAWNQGPGKTVRTFGYPYGPHLDGNRPYTGVTPKWCYGKSASKVLTIASKKVEEQQSLKCAVTAGYDGGPWLSNYSNAKRLGYVSGVTSLIADTDKNDRYDTITSAIFDGETAAIYKAASAAWSGKLVK